MTKHDKSVWIKVGSLNDIPAAGARVVRAPAGDIALFRTMDDRVFALDDKCPHRGGPLSQGMVHGHKVSCPMHGLQIDLTSGEAVAPDAGGTCRHRVRLEGDEIFLSLTDRNS
ncbi:MAG: nitrite reductase [Rhodospirillales bacterium RIFCSPLOWO2_12_FULL_58_28]|nr:MAG: nitrite reductase [Rhodospirillales bacterium RIFCSPLOWO2_02_FULL_58_16]OHC78812.1 MAG: nitrite reductase [Rhodospirillales bacterium RIFCSPLOWO2_12_FULL_58_28]